LGGVSEEKRQLVPKKKVAGELRGEEGKSLLKEGSSKTTEEAKKRSVTEKIQGER